MPGLFPTESFIIIFIEMLRCYADISTCYLTIKPVEKATKDVIDHLTTLSMCAKLGLFNKKQRHPTIKEQIEQFKLSKFRRKGHQTI